MEIMAQGNNIKEVRALMPEVNSIFQKYKKQPQEGRVPLVDLIFTKMLSKDANAYTVNTAETSAIYQLIDEGKSCRQVRFCNMSSLTIIETIPEREPFLLR